MLQQTTVAAVIPYFERFLTRWPTIEALAEAELDDVLTEWAGLGYYARARNLHKCAQFIVAGDGGHFPRSEAALRDLPGIGPYTASAIAAIAFDDPAVPVDGNVERVMARLYGIADPLPGAKKTLKRLAEETAMTLSKRASPGDYAQAVMELGATVCTPRAPDCPSCPWSDHCIARKTGQVQTLPRRLPKSVKPVRTGHIYWVTRPDGAVLLRRRPERGLLGGMAEFPSGEWVAGVTQDRGGNMPRGIADIASRWHRLPGVVRHTFTHFHLELVVVTAKIRNTGVELPERSKWVHPDAFGGEALPSVMQKVARHALLHLAGKK
jgi:A/G-specific adenine glycosylase